MRVKRAPVKKPNLNKVILVCAAILIVIALGAVGINFIKSNKKVSAPATSALLDNKTRPTATLKPSLTPAPTATAQNQTNVKILSAGDIIVQAGQLTAAKTADGYDFSKSFAPISAYLKSADLVLANFESVLAGEGSEYGGLLKYNCPDSILSALKNAGITMLTTANEHIFDYGKDGAVRTVQKIKEYGLLHTGTFTSESDSGYAVKEINGIKIAVVAFSYDHGPDSAAIPSYMYNDYKTESMKSVIKAARENGAEAVVVQIHWGTEFASEVDDATKTVAQKLLEAGADVIFGSHAHVVQPLQRKTVTVDEKTREVFIAYGLGNFYTSQRQESRDYGIIAGVEIIKNKSTGKITIGRTEYAPVWVQEKDTSDQPVYRLLPVGKYAKMEARPNDVSTNDYDRMKAIWQEVTAHLGEDKALPVSLDDKG